MPPAIYVPTYSHSLMKISFNKGSNINGLPINNIRYAVDNVLMAHAKQSLQQFLSLLQNRSRKMDLTISK